MTAPRKLGPAIHRDQPPTVYLHCPHCHRTIPDGMITSAAGAIRAAMRRKPTGGAREGAGRKPKCMDCGKKDCRSCQARGIPPRRGRPKKAQ